MVEVPTMPAPQIRGPAPSLGEPLLEVIRQPLYSALSLNGGATVPVETRFFQYSLGDVVAGVGDGAIAASLYHTNMEVAGALANPKVFEIDGIRVIVSNIEAAGTTGPDHPASPAPATPRNAALHDDMLRLFWGTHISLRVGEKDYLSGPSWLTPGNAGIGGYAAVGADDGAAAEQHLLQAVQGGGQYMALDPYSVFLPSQQSFHVKLRAPQATPPSPGVDRLVWCMLMGRLGREAQ